MNRESNKYTILFASIMVVVVALILSLTHEVLKDKQELNENIDKMSQILRSVKIGESKEPIDKVFENLITDMFLVNSNGEIIPDSKDAAFGVNLKEEMDKSIDKRSMPVYVVNINNETKYIMALYGRGLWGPLWGYISVDADGSTIYGADFSHESETPGLGAEISQSFFSEKFEGKQLFKNGEFKSVAVVKAGKTLSDKDYVDGISGGTITGKGLDSMLYESLESYSKFLSNLDKKE